MNERPIIFSGEMAKAILDGRKTQIRRVVKPQPIRRDKDRYHWPVKKTGPCGWPPNEYGIGHYSPYGQPGDRLWVRESFTPCYFDDGKPAYKADWTSVSSEYATEPRWKPSIHMPRTASRITLEITNVRVEKLRNISNPDIRAEGVGAIIGRVELLADVSTDPDYHSAAKARFKSLWDKINGKTHPWSSNPWVWVIDFKVIKRPDSN